MDSGGWRFRTTDGVVTVRSDAISIRSTPGQFLTSQLRRWRESGIRERLLTIFVLGAFLFSVFGLAYHLYTVGTTGFRWSSGVAASSLAFLGYSLWRKHGRITNIPRSEIASITIEIDDRRLNVTQRPTDRHLAKFRTDDTETTLRLATADDLRTAKRTLELRGFEIDSTTEAATEINHRIVARDGGYHCEQCDTLVTPNDKICPSCEYGLWVKTSPSTIEPEKVLSLEQ